MLTLLINADLGTGWIVTFMINERGGDSSAGYISSGFFAGLALGRVTLLWVNKKLGKRNAIFLYIAIGIAYVSPLLSPQSPIFIANTSVQTRNDHLVRAIPHRQCSSSLLRRSGDWPILSNRHVPKETHPSP